MLPIGTEREDDGRWIAEIAALPGCAGLWRNRDRSALAGGGTGVSRYRRPDRPWRAGAGQMSDKLKAIGSRIAGLRHQARLTQQELADIIGVARATIATVETGDSRAGVVTTLAVADYFRVSMDWLLCREALPKSAVPIALVGDAPMTAPEKELLDTFRSTDRQGRSMMSRFAKALRSEAPAREAAE